MIQELKGDFKTFSQAAKTPWWAAIFKPVPAMAFATCLALMVAGFYFSNGENVAQPDYLAGISEDEILAYIDNNIDDFESVSLLELSENEENDLFELNFDESEFDEYFDNNLDDFDESTLEQLF